MSEYSKAKVDKWLADFQRLFLIDPEDLENRRHGRPPLRETRFVLDHGSEPRAKIPDYEQMVAYWAWLVYGFTDETNEVPYAAQLCVDEGELSLNETWEAMSLWERQAVLFKFVPIIERCAAVAAEAVARRARKEEPL